MPEPQRVDELAEQLKADYRACFMGASGHRVLADLARLGCLAESGYVPGDASQFRDGCRHVVLHIFQACGLLSLDTWMREFHKETP